MKNLIKKLNNKPFIFISILIAVCYGNSLNNEWHLDDIQNIIENPAIQIENFNPETIKNIFYAEPSYNDKIYRPISCLSFSINWYFGKRNPFGYHIVNIIIHILSALFLYKTSIILLQAPKIKRRPPKEISFIALLGSALWAINPIQTQAVTYIVQRMASMGAMFFILALFYYCYTRLASQNTPQRLFHLFLCGLFFILALGCKENTVTFIPTILLVELLFFERNDGFAKITYFLVLTANIFLLGAACYFVYSQEYLQSFTLPYGNRPFSIGERILTQPSILLFYLSLLLFPNPSRLSIDHSFPVSTSILTPWTTLPAIICITLILALGFHIRKKNPLASYGIFFYFINHLVESTIIPLEMVFEHRNYLPSMFLFLPLAAGFRQILNFTFSRFRLIHVTFVFFIPILLIANGLGTNSRNLVWASEESLWSDALKKAPDNARTWAKLGIIYGWQKEKNSENLRKSVALLLKSSELDFPDVNFKAALIDNIGKIYARYGLHKESIVYFYRSLEINDKFVIARVDLADSLQKLGRLDESLEEIEIVLKTEDINPRFYLMKSIILLWLNRYQEAIESSKKYIYASNSKKELGYYTLGASLMKAGYYDRGRLFLRMAQKNQPNDTRILLSLLENSVLTESEDNAKKIAVQLLSTNDLMTIKILLSSLGKDYTSVPINIDTIMPFILTSAKEHLTTLTNNQ